MHMGIRIAVRSVKTVLALALLLAGCNSKKENERPADEVIEQTYKVNADASLRITNPRGSVAIRGEDTPEVRMRAVKSAPGAAQLKDITVDVTAEPVDILIKTAFLRQKKMPLFAGASAVNYAFSVPRNTRIPRVDVDDGNVSIEGIQNADVRANVVNGQLEIRNCCGDLKVAVANGGLDIIYGRCVGSYFSADAQVLNGNARLSIARGAALRVHCETVTGKITNNLDPMVELNGQSSRKTDISLGAGRRSDLTVRVTSGDITIVASEPGG
ncbi:MAG: hypothetical protein DME59_19620 [Verrucomicrobia bacterium]|nr:MAG: hypothetical protein DME59_19620 [Verrucomicrobiota bacterium]